MSDLDESLKDIFDNCFGVTISGEFIGRVEEATKDIKQVFAKNGWVKLSPIRGIEIKNEGSILRLLSDENKFMHDKYKDHMTGQEWHKRFVDELGKPTYMNDNDGRFAVYKMEWIAEAAKKAAGIEDV